MHAAVRFNRPLSRAGGACRRHGVWGQPFPPLRLAAQLQGLPPPPGTLCGRLRPFAARQQRSKRPQPGAATRPGRHVGRRRVGALLRRCAGARHCDTVMVSEACSASSWSSDAPVSCCAAATRRCAPAAASDADGALPHRLEPAGGRGTGGAGAPRGTGINWVLGFRLSGCWQDEFAWQRVLRILLLPCPLAYTFAPRPAAAAHPAPRPPRARPWRTPAAAPGAAARRRSPRRPQAAPPSASPARSTAGQKTRGRLAGLECDGRV